MWTLAETFQIFVSLLYTTLNSIVLNAQPFSLSLSWNSVGAQRKHSCFLPSSPAFESRFCQDCFSLLLSLLTELRLNPSSAKQWISQMQLASVSRAKYYKKLVLSPFWWRIWNHHVCYSFWLSHLKLFGSKQLQFFLLQLPFFKSAFYEGRSSIIISVKV